jgi:hypothetical protein
MATKSTTVGTQTSLSAIQTIKTAGQMIMRSTFCQWQLSSALQALALTINSRQTQYGHSNWAPMGRRR